MLLLLKLGGHPATTPDLDSGAGFSSGVHFHDAMRHGALVLCHAQGETPVAMGGLQLAPNAMHWSRSRATIEHLPRFSIVTGQWRHSKTGDCLTSIIQNVAVPVDINAASFT